MKKILESVIVAMMAAGSIMGKEMEKEFDYQAAWKEYREAQSKRLPRSAAEVLQKIERAASEDGRAPDAVKAFALRFQAEREFTDEFKEEWIPALAARVEAASESVRPYLDLYLAHVYTSNSKSWRWGGMSPTKLTDSAAEAKLPAWSPERLPASLEALFARILAAAPRLQAEPVAKWDGILDSASMPDTCRPTLYDLAVHDMLDFYGETIPDKTLEKGLKLIDGLLAFHADDTNVNARADAELSRIGYEYAFAELPQKEKDARYAAALDDFIAKYLAISEVGALAAYYRAEEFEQDKEFVRAKELAEKGFAAWPKSAGGTNCRALVDRIVSPRVSFTTERVWSEPFAPIKIDAKNTDKVFFKLAKISYEDFIDDDWSERRKICEKANKARPVKNWSVGLEHFTDYAFHQLEVAVPKDLAPGYYYLFAGSDDRFDEKGLAFYAERIMVSDIALTLAYGNGRYAGTVFTSKEGARVKGAKVELWGSLKWGEKVKRLATVETDASGEFAIKDQDWKQCRLRIFANGSEAIDGWCGRISAGSEEVAERQPNRISVVTDRAIYRPGQPIKFKGYAAYVDPYARDFRVQPGARVEVEFMDPNRKRVAGFALTANEWGTFIGEFTAPRDRVTGNYSITARYLHANGSSTTSVSVEEYKRPKFTAEIGRAPGDAALGKEIELVGTAKTYSGLPVAGAKVKWSVDRATRYPCWWRWFGVDDEDDGDNQVAEGEVETDETGAFRIRFTPVAAPTVDLAGEPSFVFTVKADVTDTTGETRSAKTRCEIGTVAWRSEAYAPEGQFAGESFEATVSLASLDGTKVSAKGELAVYRLNGPERPVRAPITDYRRRETPGAWDWRTWENGEIVKKLPIEVTNGVWKGSLDLSAGAYRLVFETADPAGKKVTGRGEVAVADRAAEKLGFAAPDYFVLKRPQGVITVGSKIAYLWASGYAEGYGRVELYSNGKLVSRTDTDFAKPFVFGEYTLKEEDRGQIEVRSVFFREGRLYTHRDVVNVAWDNMDLKVEKEHFTSRLTAGAEESWKFKVSGKSEVLAFMYDRSLDAYRSHFVTFPFQSFSVPVRWIRELFSVNSIESLRHVAGREPFVRGGLTIGWRDFDEFFGSFQRVSYSRPHGEVLKRGRAGDMLMCACAAAPCAESAAFSDDCEGEVLECEAAEVPEDDLEDESKKEPEVAVRKNLQETAFFLPQLETDADGRFTLTFTAPEAISGWNFTLVAHDKGLRSGVFRDDSVTTTRPLMVEPNAPRFVREGDEFRFAVKVTNTTDEPQEAAVSLAFEDLASLTPAEIGGGERKVALKSHETTSVEFPVAIPDGQGYLKYTAKAVGARFADGEEGALAVLSRRIEVREAVQLNVRGKATKTFALTNLVDSVKNGGTIRNIDLTVRVVSRPAWYAVASLPYLMEFPHECCEQVFSRYYANALAEYLANSDPKIRATFDAWKTAGADALKSPLELNEDLKAIALEATPWLREAADETAAKARLGNLFDAERLASEGKNALEKLRIALNADDLLPWFPGGSSSCGISLYVAIGCVRLESIAGTEKPDWFAKLVRALDREEKKDLEERLDWAKKNGCDITINGYDLHWLYLHSFAGVPNADEKTVKILMDHLKKECLDFGIRNQAYAAIVLDRAKDHARAMDILKSLKERAVVSEEFGMYWKLGSFFSSSVFAAPVSMQAAVIEAFKEVAKDEATVDDCIVWILKQKQTQAWKSTAATSDAIYAILKASGTDLLAGDRLAEVSLGGLRGAEPANQDSLRGAEPANRGSLRGAEPANRGSLRGAEPANRGRIAAAMREAEAGTGEYSAQWRGEEIKPEMGVITLTGVQEKGVVWGGVNWTYLEDIDKVRAFEPKELRIEKQYFRKIRTSGGTRLEPVAGVLEQGDELVARLRIRADRTFEFVHIQDERPSTAEPVDVLSSYRWQDGVGYYQSTRDAATHYYIDRLDKGEFVLETSYRVQQHGVFSGGLAEIQCMYAPEFTAHSTSEKVEVR